MIFVNFLIITISELLLCLNFFIDNLSINTNQIYLITNQHNNWRFYKTILAIVPKPISNNQLGFNSNYRINHGYFIL